MIFPLARGLSKAVKVSNLDLQAIVSQPSKCLKFMTFREGCFVIHVERKYLTLFDTGEGGEGMMAPLNVFIIVPKRLGGGR